MTLVARLLLGSALVVGCARPTPAPAPAGTSAQAPAASATTPPAPSTTPPAEALAQPATLKGDEQLPEPWRSRFRAWLSGEKSSPYVAVLDSQVVSNAAAVVLQRRQDANGACLQGPSRLDLIEHEGTKELTREVQHFGDDCCPGTECARTPNSWNLRYLALLAARDWQQLSRLVPAKRQLVWTINGGEVPTSRFTRKDVVAGRLQQAPSCGLIYNVPSCDALDAGGTGFTCRCDGGGSHVTYHWEREGPGFVIVAINEESH
jgi:hypothetical protein